MASQNNSVLEVCQTQYSEYCWSGPVRLSCLMFLDYFTHLQLELFMASVSGYMECVKLHHGNHNRMSWYITYIPQCGALIFTSSVVYIYYSYNMPMRAESGVFIKQIQTE